MRVILVITHHYSHRLCHLSPNRVSHISHCLCRHLDDCCCRLYTMLSRTTLARMWIPPTSYPVCDMTPAHLRHHTSQSVILPHSTRDVRYHDRHVTRYCNTLLYRQVMLLQASDSVEPGLTLPKSPTDVTDNQSWRPNLTLWRSPRHMHIHFQKQEW